MHALTLSYDGAVCDRNVLQPDLLEEHVMSAVMKHLSLMDTVRHLSAAAQQQNEDYVLLSSVVDEVYRRYDVLLRQLQVCPPVLCGG